MKETIIYLIRHSEQLKMNITYLSGENEQIKNEKIVLSTEGERKAKELSEKEELKNIDVLYSSNYVRAIATAKYIANQNKININVDERLGERKLGDLVTLKELGSKSKNDYTTDQLIDENFKNKDGESNLDVRKRMTESIMEILDNYQGKKIAIVSHGAAIKFFLQNFCKYDKETETLIYNDKTVCHKKLESPCLIKIIFKDKTIYKIVFKTMERMD